MQSAGLYERLSRFPPLPGISKAAHELAIVAETEEYEGKRQLWSSILESELSKARQIQQKLPALRFREVEQVVFATFLPFAANWTRAPGQYT